MHLTEPTITDVIIMRAIWPRDQNWTEALTKATLRLLL